MKPLALVVLASLFSIGAFAQGAGIKAGVNFANQDITDITTESKTGFHFGAFFEIRASDKVTVQPEVLFSTHGSNITINNVSEQVDLSYLNIPLLLKFKFLGIFNAHLGPQFGILSNAEYDGQDINQQLKSLDLALIGGAGINLPMGLVGGARYVYGLTNYNESFDPSNGTGFPEVKNKTVQLYLGLKLF